MSSEFDEIQWSGELRPRHELESDGNIPMQRSEQMSDLIERAKESAKWAEAENDHLSEGIFNEMIEALEKAAAHIRELEDERDKWRDSAEAYRKDAEPSGDFKEKREILEI